jgi:hypothetical protein
MTISKQHLEFPDEFNDKGNKTHGAKNKKMAQDCGIKFARKFFESMKDVSHQSTTFSWNTYAEGLRGIVEASVYGMYRHLPKNIDELEKIASDAAVIEWSILVSEHPDLPVRTVTTQEKIHALSQLATSSFLRIQEVDFYHDELPKKDQNEHWKTLYDLKYPKEDNIKKSLSKMHDYVEKNCSEEEKELVIKEVTAFINDYYSSQKF